MRLAGTINYPTKAKRERGYIAELVTLHINLAAPAYTVEHLRRLAGLGTSEASDPREEFETKRGRTDDELTALLEASPIDGEWHKSMLRRDRIDARTRLALTARSGWCASNIAETVTAIPISTT